MKRVPGSYKRLVHGTPITPMARWAEVNGKSFCVSYAAPRDLERAIKAVGKEEILILDNGAFSAWTKGLKLDDEYWAGYWAWAVDALERCPNAIAVIPDVIGGGIFENWLEARKAVHKYVPYELTGRLMYVWHMNEPLEILKNAARLFNFVAIGSSDEFDIKKGTKKGSVFDDRMIEAFSVIDAIEIFRLGGSRPWVHMMRGLGVLEKYRWDSADSVTLAINPSRDIGKFPGATKLKAEKMNWRVNGLAELPLAA